MTQKQCPNAIFKNSSPITPLSQNLSAASLAADFFVVISRIRLP